MKQFTFLSVLFCMLFFVSLKKAVAKTPGECHRELKAMCKDKVSGGGKFQCMQESRSKLNEECQKIMAEGKEKIKDAVQACKDDREKFCKDVAVGEGRIHDCLKQHLGELSAACKERIENAKPFHGLKGKQK